MERRLEHVRLLAIFHFIYAGLIAVGTLVPVIWLMFASLWWPDLATEIEREANGMPVAASGALALGFAGFGVFVGWVWAGCLVFAGRSLLTRRRHTFCMVVAGLACLAIPLGTLLGVSTLVILNQDETRRLFSTAT